MQQTVEELIGEATDRNDWHRRRLGLIGLGYRKGPEILPFLMEALEDPVSDVRHAAIVALGRRGDREAMVELLRPRILASPDARIRWAATTALGRLGDHRIIEQLVGLVDDEEWLVSNQAVVVLREKIEEIIQAHDLKLARVLIRMLHIPDPGIVEMAVEGLRNLDRDAIPMLSEALKSVWEPVRRHAARTLGRIGDRHCSRVLIEALRDPSHPVRAEAATALGKITRTRSLRPLVAALGDYDESVRKNVIAALVQFGPRAVKALCIELDHSKSKLAKCAAIEALGAIGDPTAIPILINHLSSSYHLVRSAVMAALPRFGNEVVEPLRGVLSFNRSDISGLEYEAGHPDDLPARIRAVRALGDLEDHRAVPLLARLLGDPEAEIAIAAGDALVKIGCAAWGRRGAATVIGQVGDRTQIPLVMELLDDDSFNVRRAAVFALGELKAGREIARLMKIAIEDDDPSVRRAALSVLRDVAPGSSELFDTALEALEDPSADVRVRAVRIVGEFADERATEPLLAQLSDAFSHVRTSAESAVITQGKAALPGLFTILETGSIMARRRAASALGRIGEARAIPKLEAHLEREKDVPTLNLTREALSQLRAAAEDD